MQRVYEGSRALRLSTVVRQGTQAVRISASRARSMNGVCEDAIWCSRDIRWPTL